MTRVSDGSQSAFPIQASPKPDGSYQLDVPAGRYVVELEVGGWTQVYGFSHGGLRIGDVPPDTLLVDVEHSPAQIDFDLGSLRAHLDVAPHLEGEHGLIRLYLRGHEEVGRYDRSYMRFGGAPIQNLSLIHISEPTRPY